MAHVIPTLRMAPPSLHNPANALAASLRKAASPASPGRSAPAADFRTVLESSTSPAPAGPVSTGTIGSLTPFPPASTTPVTTPSIPVSSMAPTAQALFGANPWVTTATGTGPAGNTYGFNPYYFATPATAAKVAQMLGGTVVAQNDITPYGPFKQSQANLMVQMPDGTLHNAGLIAAVFDHGYSQVTVDQLLAGEMHPA